MESWVTGRLHQKTVSRLLWRPCGTHTGKPSRWSMKTRKLSTPSSPRLRLRTRCVSLPKMRPASVRGLRHGSPRRKSSHCLYWLLALGYQRRELIN